MTIFERWSATGVPNWLRAWLPSPYAVSQASLAPADGPAMSATRALVGAVLAALGGGALAVMSSASVGLALHANTQTHHALPRHPGPGAMLCSVMTTTPAGVGLLIVASLVIGAKRPQIARLALLAVGLHAALLPLAVAAPWVSTLSASLGLALFALSLLSPRWTPQLARVAGWLAPRALALVAFIAALGAVSIAVAATRWNGLSSLPAVALTARLSDALVSWVFGAGLLALSALMLAVTRAAGQPWRDADAWLDGSIGEGRVLRFASGVAPRQASEVFGEYRGPVVVIPLGETRKGVFRGDGAPDDGWTVPGTIETLRDAVATSTLSAHATTLAVMCLATASLLAAALSTLRTW